MQAECTSSAWFSKATRPLPLLSSPLHHCLSQCLFQISISNKLQMKPSFFLPPSLWLHQGWGVFFILLNLFLMAAAQMSENTQKVPPAVQTLNLTLKVLDLYNRRKTAETSYLWIVWLHLHRVIRLFVYLHISLRWPDCRYSPMTGAAPQHNVESGSRHQQQIKNQKVAWVGGGQSIGLDLKIGGLWVRLTVSCVLLGNGVIVTGWI